MTNNKVIIDYTKCQYNTFDGGGSQRTKCILDGKFCDCLRDKDCYYKQLARKMQECEKLKSALEGIEKLIKQIGGGSVYANGRYKEIQEFINKAKEQE